MNDKKITAEKVKLYEGEVLLREIFDGNDLSKENITVVDSIMGSGKTSWAIDKMKFCGGKYMYITPYLDEIERVKSSLEGVRHLYAPSNQNEYGAKKYAFYNFIKSGLDVISTHSLFTTCDKDILEHIKKHDYTLILDEVMEVVKITQLSKSDYDMLLETNSIRIADNGRVQWLNDNYEGSFDWFKEYALASQLYKHSSEDTDKVAFFVWQFPAEIFKYFKEVYILTYLFDGQIQKYYFDMHELKYEYKQIEVIDGEYTLVDFDYENECVKKRKFRELINIYEGKLNNVGNVGTFSVNYFKGHKHGIEVKQLKKNTENYMQHIAQGKSEFNMWTTFKDFRNKLKGRGYSKGFVTVNARATNQFANKTNLAYLCNRFLPTYVDSYFNDLDIEIDQELWALTELVQWIWRSGIRNNEPINIYIPSVRMRTLLNQWLCCQEVLSRKCVA